MRPVLFSILLTLIPTCSSHAQSYPPSTDWWKSEPKCYQGIVAKPNIIVEGGGQNCDIGVIKKTLNGKENVYADWIHDGHAGMNKSAADDVAVAVAGINGDVVYLYGIRADGNVVVANPTRDYGHGRKSSVYVEHDKILVLADGSSPLWLYCWTGTDWIEGDNPSSCNPKHHSRLVALRARGESYKIVVPEHVDP
jgi:hypothetical protein